MKPAPDDETTGLPGLRSWKQVYIFVALVLAAWVVLLAIFGRMFS
jgi:hypothetical protein